MMSQLKNLVLKLKQKKNRNKQVFIFENNLLKYGGKIHKIHTQKD